MSIVKKGNEKILFKAGFPHFYYCFCYIYNKEEV